MKKELRKIKHNEILEGLDYVLKNFTYSEFRDYSLDHGDIEIDSLDKIEMLMDIEDYFDISLDDNEVVQLDTFSNAYKLIASRFEVYQ